MSDTIGAIATGSAASAIGIIRLSGDRAIEIVRTLFTPSSGKSMAEYQDRLLVHGKLRDSSGELLDECLCTISRAPHSYTGEDTAELQCHGGPVVMRSVLESLFAAGCRQARPGEFTQRAFLNGRLDLTQAEAVIDLIDADTSRAAKNAAAQLGGAISRRAGEIYDSLVDIISHYQGAVDYPDEDIEDFRLIEYTGVFTSAIEGLKALMGTYRRGSIMKNGVLTAILGRPNAGKSSLMNAILGYDRAIVTDIPGTTRDTIEEAATLGGVKLRLTDTAGLRETGDTVESMGIARAQAIAEEAELALVLFDPVNPSREEDLQILRSVQEAEHIVVVCTKSDLVSVDTALADLDGLRADAVISVSSVTGQGIEALANAVSSMYEDAQIPAGGLLTNPRQADAIGRAIACLESALKAMEQGSTPDIVLTDTENALSALGELTGRTVRDDIVSRIFERFCVGK